MVHGAKSSIIAQYVVVVKVKLAIHSKVVTIYHVSGDDMIEFISKLHFYEGD